MFGREARLPVDLAFGTSLDHSSATSHKGYVDRLRHSLKVAYEQAQAASDQRGARNKRNFDLKVRVQDLQPGDRVLLRNLGVPGRHKLADRWRSEPYVICRKLPGLPVYKLKPEGKVGPLKTWHRNHLLPLAEAVRIPPVRDSPEPVSILDTPRPNTRSQTSRAENGEASQTSEDEERALDWLWPSPTPGTSTIDLPTTEDTPDGTLNPEATEFIPFSPSSDYWGEACDTYSEEDPRGSTPEPVSEEEPVAPEPENPREQRARRVIRPPKKLTYPQMGNSSEDSVVTARRSAENPDPPFSCAAGQDGERP